MFFSFLAVFPLPESYQNDPKFHFNTLLRSDTQKSSKKIENTTRGWSRCEIVFGPPPPAKADIATAILTNVIEHLVLLLPPNKHAFTAKAVWADLYPISMKHWYIIPLKIDYIFISLYIPLGIYIYIYLPNFRKFYNWLPDFPSVFRQH